VRKQQAARADDESDEDNDEDSNFEDLEVALEKLAIIKDHASHHVKMHIAQREFVNSFIAKATETLNLPLEERILALTQDMAQNGALPTLRGEQPGDSYYFSPMTQFIHGIVDNATQKMNSYIWGEGQANRGADNIVSLLYWDLKRRGVFESSVGHLVLIADNCAAQNKNFCVLKFLMWLVEGKHAKKVTLVFLIKGHTKNFCDNRFNLLKQGTAGRNIWDEVSLDQAYTEKNKDFIDLQRLDETNSDRWLQWRVVLDDFYKNPPSGTTHNNHIFCFGHDPANPTSYTRQTFRDAEPFATDLRTNAFSLDERAENVKSLTKKLAVLPAPGMRAIKQLGMSKVIRLIVPEEFEYFYNRELSEEQVKENNKRVEEKRKAQTAQEQAKKSRLEAHRKK